jgi:hypothetical protein
MRKVNSQRIHSSNPSLLFARGVESLVSEHLHRPRFEEYDETEEKRRVAVKQEPRGNLFSLLMRQFANS